MSNKESPAYVPKAKKAGFEELNAEKGGLPPNLENLELALLRSHGLEAQLHKLQFLIRDTQSEILTRAIKEGWLDLIRVNASGVSRRLAGIKRTLEEAK